MAECHLTDFDVAVLAHATHFVAFAFGGRGRRVRSDHATRDDARVAAEALATRSHGSMVYAVWGIKTALVDTFSAKRD